MKKACVALTALTLLLGACGSTEQQTPASSKGELQQFLKSRKSVVSSELLKKQGWTSIRAIEQGYVSEGQHTFAPQAPFSFKGGTIRSYLAGPRGTNFDISLIRFDVDKAEWVVVKKSNNSGSREFLKAKVSKGIYTFVVSSTAGSGRFLVSYRLDSTDIGDQAPVAAFNTSSNGLKVSFTDQSTDDKGIKSWNWDFGNGQTSNKQNPTVNYRAKGTYTVKLTVTDTNGQTNSTSKSIKISKTPGNGEDKAPNAAFNVSSNGLKVSFTDQSTDDKGIKSWNWDFGNGQTSTKQNPTINYRAKGTYTVKLTVTDTKGQTSSTSQSIKVSKTPNNGEDKAPNAAFDVSRNGLKVSFTDQSTDDKGIRSWNWDFGNGQTSDKKNPTVNYRAKGTYTVKLTVTDTKGQTNSTSKSIEVNKKPSNGNDKAPKAAFDVFRKGLRVKLTDQSTDDKGIQSWKWDLGNGEDSTAKNPVVNYRARGNYTVKLTVTDTKGQTNTTSKTFEVAKSINDGGPSNEAPVAGFSFRVNKLKVNFTDSSRDSDGRVTKWSWDFGNNKTSRQQNPTVTYRKDGTYDVRLTVTDDKGATNSTSQQVTVKGSVKPPVKSIYDPVTSSNINEVLKLSNDRTVILDFGATWCGPCKKLKPLIKAKAKKDKGKWILGLIDADQSPSLKNKYNIKAYPTLIAFKNGRESSRHKTGLSGWERWLNNQIR